MPSREPLILVVEDDASVRSLLTDVLEGEGYEVVAQANAKNLNRTLRRLSPDLAILDVGLPDGPDGYTVARALRRHSLAPILFLTGRDSVADRLAGFDAGGDDYLVKPFAVEELSVRVRALLRRALRQGRPAVKVADLVVDDAKRTITRGGKELQLTPREYRLLVALAARAGQPVTKVELLAEVWGDANHDPNVVEAHMSGLRRKLEAEGPRLVHTLRGVGYVLRA